MRVQFPLPAPSKGTRKGVFCWCRERTVWETVRRGLKSFCGISGASEQEYPKGVQILYESIPAPGTK